MNPPLEQQINKLIDTLRKDNETKASKGGIKIPETEYVELKSLLMKKVVRS